MPVNNQNPSSDFQSFHSTRSEFPIFNVAARNPEEPNLRYHHHLGTSTKRFVATEEVEITIKEGTSNSLRAVVKRMCLTFMAKYSGKSLEELRLEDYELKVVAVSKANPSADFNDFIVTGRSVATPTSSEETNDFSSSLSSPVESGLSAQQIPPILQFTQRSDMAVLFNFPGSEQPSFLASSAQTPTTSTPSLTFNMPTMTAMTFDPVRMMFTMHFT